MNMETTSIIGAGALGTALAQLLTFNINNVTLYTRNKRIADAINKTKINSIYYPTVKLSEKIQCTNDLNSCFNSNIIFLCVPSSSVRNISKIMKQYIDSNKIIISTSKGIEYPTLKRMSQIIYEETNINPVVFSGPTFASELILNLPSIVTIASSEKRNLNKVKRILSNRNFLIDTNTDVIGVEMGGIAKNINAIAYGIMKGMGLGENARSALLTKGFIEMKQLITKMGGDPNTLDGYSGFGDLVLTSFSEKSRNHTLGVLYGQKILIDEQLSGILFEGKKSIKSIKDLCYQYNIESIVTNFVYEVICENISPEKSYLKLWSRMVV